MVRVMLPVKIDVYHGTRSKSYDCKYADVTFSGTFNACFTDNRNIVTIAKDFDGVDSITVHLISGDHKHNGYSELVYIAKDGNTVTVKLAKPQNSEV